MRLDLGFSLDYDRAVLGEIMFWLLIDDDLMGVDFTHGVEVKKIERNIENEALTLDD